MSKLTEPGGQKVLDKLDEDFSTEELEKLYCEIARSDISEYRAVSEPDNCELARSINRQRLGLE